MITPQCLISSTETTREPATVARDQRENESHAVPLVCHMAANLKALKDAALGGSPEYLLSFPS